MPNAAQGAYMGGQAAGVSPMMMFDPSKYQNPFQQPPGFQQPQQQPQEQPVQPQPPAEQNQRPETLGFHPQQQPQPPQPQPDFQPPQDQHGQQQQQQPYDQYYQQQYYQDYQNNWEGYNYNYVRILLSFFFKNVIKLFESHFSFIENFSCQNLFTYGV